MAASSEQDWTRYERVGHQTCFCEAPKPVLSRLCEQISAQLELVANGLAQEYHVAYTSSYHGKTPFIILYFASDYLLCQASRQCALAQPNPDFADRPLLTTAGRDQVFRTRQGVQGYKLRAQVKGTELVV